MRFLEVIGGWINELFSNEEAIYLVVLLLVGFVVLFVLGSYIAPVLAGLIFAFLLTGIVDRLVAWHVPRLAAVSMVFVLFVGSAVALVIGIAPLIWRQLTESVNAMPGVIDRLRVLLADMSAEFPGILSPMAADSWLAALNAELTEIGKDALQGLVAQVPNIFGIIIYLILIPISVFFFLKDGKRMVAWVLGMLPRHRTLLDSVGREMNVQIANYIRGKTIEILVVGIVTYAAFLFLGLNYAALLGFIVGISVLVPFVGAAVVTVPVMAAYGAVGFLQYGWSLEFAYVMAAYGGIQALDGNVLVPILFSEANDLHPITIIVAVLAFGGLWGFWGIFFAIPLATLVKAIFNAWPRTTAAEAAEP